MKKLRANIDRYFDKLEERWQALPVRKQHQYTLCFFVGYLLLTAGVIFKVWYDTADFPPYSLINSRAIKYLVKSVSVGLYVFGRLFP